MGWLGLLEITMFTIKVIVVSTGTLTWTGLAMEKNYRKFRSLMLCAK